MPYDQSGRVTKIFIATRDVMSSSLPCGRDSGTQGGKRSIGVVDTWPSKAHPQVRSTPSREGQSTHHPHFLPRLMHSVPVCNEPLRAWRAAESGEPEMQELGRKPERSSAIDGKHRRKRLKQDRPKIARREAGDVLQIRVSLTLLANNRVGRAQSLLRACGPHRNVKNPVFLQRKNNRYSVCA